MANKFHKYDDLLDESGSYRAAAEKALIRSFYGNEKDLLDYLYSKFYSFKVETRFKNQLPSELYEIYGEAVGLHKRRIHAIIESIKPQVGEKALDLACNLGAVGYHLTNRGLSVIGLDLDGITLGLCQKLWTDQRMPLIQANGEALPLPASNFDLVIAADFYEHIPDPVKEAVTVEIHRILKPDGRLVLHTDNLIRYDISLFVRRIGALLWGQNPHRQQHHFSDTHTDVSDEGHIADILEKHGFQTRTRTYFPGRFKIDPLLIRIPLIRRWMASSYIMVMEKAR